MIKIKVDGKTVEAPANGILLQFLNEELGLDIPHYCYHPALTTVGSCRLCQVVLVNRRQGPDGKEQVNRMLAVSCRQPLQEGMEVETNTEQVRLARRQAMEFLLANHPLDCPICDKAGECSLQDYAFATGQHEGRNREPRRHADKLVAMGEVIIHDRERCILCTRCVRFFDGIDSQHQLGVINRGDRSYIATFFDDPLTGDYQGCLADVCPVGAMTLKGFRGKQRVWNLTSAPSICPHCSRGCNITIDRDRGDQVVRIRPRVNKDVNDCWLCDNGRLAFADLNQEEERFVYPAAGGEPVVMEHALGIARQLITDTGDKLLALAGPCLTNQEAELFMALFKQTGQKGFLAPQIGAGDQHLQTGDHCPNRAGLTKAGLAEINLADLTDKIKAANAVYLVGEYIENLIPAEAWHALENKCYLYQGLNRNRATGATVALPAANWSEKGGTWTNVDGLDQTFSPTMPPPGEALSHSEIFQALAEEVAK